MFALFYTFLYIMMSRKEYMYWQAAKIESQNTFVCERAERASDFLSVWYSFTVKKVSFFTINVKFKVILSSKSGGGGMFVQAIPPPQNSGGGVYIPPIPPGFTPVLLGGG